MTKQAMQRKGVLAIVIALILMLALAGIFVAAMNSSTPIAQAEQATSGVIAVGDSWLFNNDPNPSNWPHIDISNMSNNEVYFDGYDYGGYGYVTKDMNTYLWYNANESTSDYFSCSIDAAGSFMSISMEGHSDAPIGIQVTDGDGTSEHPFVLSGVWADSDPGDSVNLNAIVPESVRFYNYDGTFIMASQYEEDSGGYKSIDVLPYGTDIKEAPEALGEPDGWVCSICGQVVAAGSLSSYMGNAQPHVGDLPAFSAQDWDNSKHGVVSCSFTAHYENSDSLENITFSPSITAITGDTASGGIVYRTIDATQTNTVTVSYVITNNDGVSAIKLVPEYDKTAFTLTNANVVSNDETTLGAATVTGTEVEADMIKIVWEKDVTYNGTGVALLTLTFTVNNEAIANGYYDFGLDLANCEAYVIDTESATLGNHIAVPILLDRTSYNSTIKITRRQTATLTIGYNQKHDTTWAYGPGIEDEEDIYRFDYAKSSIEVQKVDELQYTEDDIALEPTSIANGLVVFYTITDENDNSIPLTSLGDITMTWYRYTGYYEEPWEAITDEQSEPTAPAAIPGTYRVDISVAASTNYYAIETVSRKVTVVPRQVVICIHDKESAYGETLVALTHSEYSVLTGDSLEIALSTTATSTSAAGTYPISGSVVSMAGYYTVTFRNEDNDGDTGTYTITQTQVTLTPVGNTVPYTGEYYTFDYTVSNPDLSQDALANIKSTLNNAGAVTVTAGGETQQRNAGQYLMYVGISSNPTSCQLNVATGDTYFTITPMAITITATPNQSSVFGQEIYVDQSKYTLSANPIAADTYTVSIAKAAGTNAGNYTLTPSINFTVGSNASNYDITTVTGTYTITSIGKTAEYIRSFFSGATEDYTAAQYDLLVVDNGIPSWISSNYSASNNLQTYAGNYTMTVTVTLDQTTANNYTDGVTNFAFNDISGAINTAAVTIKADDHSSYYGATPAQLTGYTVTSGTVYGSDSLNVTMSTNPAISTTTSVGDYVISISASNANYSITTVPGTYSVLKATPSINLTAQDIYYNRDLVVTSSASVNTLSATPTLTYYRDYECTQVVATPTAAGTYYVKAFVEGTDNYYSAQSTTPVEFIIQPVRLEGVTFTATHGNVTWTAVTKDTGKSNDETGVTAKDLKTDTAITYTVYNSDDEVIAVIEPGQTLSFNAEDSTSYYVIASSSDNSYTSSRSSIGAAYAVTFSEGDPEGVVSGMPATQYVFNGQTAVEPAAPTSTQGFFSYWSLNNAQYSFSATVSNDIQLVAVWGVYMRTITLKYLTSSNTEGEDMFTLSIPEGGTISYENLSVEPVKTSDNDGYYYTFANVWIDEDENEYSAVNHAISGYTVSEDMTFVAKFTKVYKKFTITYYFSNNESKTMYDETDNPDGYQVYGEVQEVYYDDVISYTAFSGATVTWFTPDFWYADSARTEAAPEKMPAINISVFGSYKFNIGKGDVNGNGVVTTDDITLYRRWIVGGYVMSPVQAGTEWQTATAANFNSNAIYYLMRVADINVDESKDIRDVSITRMALVGGYAWDIVTGESVLGDEIVRSQKASDYETLAAWFAAGNERISIIDDITADSADFAISTAKDIYIDLCGNTLTVKSINFSTSGTGATITLRNGTIVTTSGITVTAPNGNVVINNVTAYDNGNLINLQAASSSLHLFGAVAFRNGTVAESTAADVKVATGTHIVIEEAAQIVAKTIVAAIIENNAFVADTTAEITITNESTATEAIEIVGNYVEENSTVESKIITKVTTKEELLAVESGKTVYLGADIIYAGQIEIVNKTMILDLNGYTIGSTDSFALNIKGVDGDLTIKGEGNVIAAEACVRAKAGATLTIDGGTYTTVDNYVIGTHGSVGNGGNTITINAGTFNGNIQTSGYIACGVYVANSDVVVINGGTFNIDGGIGILARSGNTTVKEDVEFNFTNTNNLTAGGVGDKSLAIPVNKEIVMDLSLATYPGGIPVLAEDGGKEVYIVAVNNNGTVGATGTFVTTFAELNAASGCVVLGADITTVYTFVFEEDVVLYLNNHTIKNTYGVALSAKNGAKMTINGSGNVYSQEMCVMAFSGSEIVINGGTYTSYDNAVVGTNGTKNANNDFGHNTITINAGTFNGYIETNGYVACGIYVANSDTVTVNGGTFNVENGCGILARSGNTTVKAGVVFNVTGDGTLGKVGDSNVTVPTGEELVLDILAKYPGGTPTLTNNSSYEVYVRD